MVDQYGGNCGGLRCVKGFHLECDDYFLKNHDIVTDGDFYRLNVKKHASLYDRCQPIDAPAGSLILWDNRIVHSTCEKCQLDDTREVVYTSFLPAGIPCNDKYAKEQALNIEANIAPPTFCKKIKGDNIQADRDWNISDLSDLQRELLFLSKN